MDSDDPDSSQVLRHHRLSLGRKDGDGEVECLVEKDQEK